MAEERGDQTGNDGRTGRHAAPDEATTEAPVADEASTSDSTTSDATTSNATTSGSTTSGSTTSDATVATAAPSEPATEHVATPDAEPTRQAPASEAAPTEHVAASSSPDAAPTEHLGGPAAEPTRQMQRPQGPPPATTGRGGDGARRAVRRVTGLLSTLLRIAGALLAVVLVAFVVLTLVGVNPDNAVAQLVAEGADVLVMRFRDLFLPADPRLALVVDYGLAALFWLVVGFLAARVVRALGRLV